MRSDYALLLASLIVTLIIVFSVQIGNLVKSFLPVLAAFTFMFLHYCTIVHTRYAIRRASGKEANPIMRNSIKSRVLEVFTIGLGIIIYFFFVSGTLYFVLFGTVLIFVKWIDFQNDALIVSLIKRKEAKKRAAALRNLVEWQDWEKQI